MGVIPRALPALAFGLVILLASCGTGRSLGGPGSSPATSTPASPFAPVAPSSSPAASSHPLLLGLLHGSSMTQAGDQATLVALDGKVVASYSYQPLPRPSVGNAATIFPAQGMVAAGGLYFIDGKGDVRVLLPSGSVALAASFPITTNQQLVSFAVRPDGKRLGAIVLTLPPLKNPPPVNPLESGFFQDGAHAYLDLEWADFGRPTTKTLHKDLGTSNFLTPTLLAGWDANGPVATLDSGIGRQDVPASYPMSGSALVHLADDGAHLDTIGGNDCRPADELADGTTVCIIGTGLPTWSIRDPAGHQLWAGGGFAQNGCTQLPRLAPDGSAIACTSGIVKKQGPTVPYSDLPKAAMTPNGWIDSSRVVLADENRQAGLGIVDASTGKYAAVIESGAFGFVGVIPPST